MSVLDKLVSLVAPHHCVGCGQEGDLLCPACSATLPRAYICCYRCRRFSRGSLTCDRCWRHSRLFRVRAATLYAGSGKTLVWQLKSKGAQAAATVMAARLLPLIKPSEHTLIATVPTATSRIRQRGYDQAHLIARQLARGAGLPWLNCLARSGQTHQVGAGRAQRRAQLKDAFRVTQARFVRGAHIILVDDVVTTGATLEAAAAVLHAAGAAKIEALTFAQTPLKFKNKTNAPTA